MTSAVLAVLFFATALNIAAVVVADRNPSLRWLGWIWFFTLQAIMGFFALLGWFVLIPFCLSEAWFRGTIALVSIKDGRPIDAWKWNPLNYVYGNPEDGVSGQQALIGDAAGQLVPYMPDAPAWWRAYLWSGWRNSCDALKYRFAWANGPSAMILGKKVGWWDYYGRKLPVL
jgi:hypothetical protein